MCSVCAAAEVARSRAVQTPRATEIRFSIRVVVLAERPEEPDAGMFLRCGNFTTRADAPRRKSFVTSSSHARICDRRPGQEAVPFKNEVMEGQRTRSASVRA